MNIEVGFRLKYLKKFTAPDDNLFRDSEIRSTKH